MKARGRLIKLATISSVLIPYSVAGACDSLEVTINATASNRGFEESFQSPTAWQWISIVGSCLMWERSDSSMSSFSPDRQRPLAAIRGGGTDNWSRTSLCRNQVVSSGPYVQWTVSPYSRWGKSYKAVRSLEDMSDDDDDTFFTSRSTRAEGSQAPYSQNNNAEPEPSLPSYPDDFPGDSAAIAKGYSRNDDVDDERTRPLLHFIGDDLSESEQEMLSHRLSHSGSEQEHDDQKVPHSPVVYRYFGRSRVRTHRVDSVPFILIGPCVDHWKAVGQILASRGFNVMACERIEAGHDESDAAAAESNPDVNSEPSENLVLSILDALRWKRAVLVGCDDESILAIKAALKLAPDRIVGLVLCGDLVSANDFVERLSNAESDRRDHKPSDFFSVDSFLLDNLDCPSAVIWDGGIPKVWRRSKTAAAAMLADKRSLVLGGGSAPHRRLPEQFAWVLTRFMEEKVLPQINPLAGGQSYDADRDDVVRLSEDEASSGRGNRISLPYNLDELLSPGSFLVAGRVAAAAIFYITALKVAVYQYDNVRSGVIGLRSGYEAVTSWRKYVLQAVVNFVCSFGSLFGRQRAVVVESSDEPLDIETRQEEVAVEGSDEPLDVETRQEEDAVEGSDETLDSDTEQYEDEAVEDAPPEPEIRKGPSRIDYLDRVIV